jgi:hypothetical protein
VEQEFRPVLKLRRNVSPPVLTIETDDNTILSDNPTENSSAADVPDIEESSDEEDVFRVTAAVAGSLSKEYRNSPKERWRLAIAEMRDLCRSDCTIPLDPFDTKQTQIFDDLSEAYRLPTWHCPFRSCTACDASSASSAYVAHESLWWDHIEAAHDGVVSRIITKHKLARDGISIAETKFALVIAGMLEREREFIPKCGIAVDRRTLRHVGEVFYEDNIKSLMCFICGCKHCYHMGYDKFGKSHSKGLIKYRSDSDMRWHAVLHGAARGEVRDAWKYNLSYKRFKTRFGSAVAMDPNLQEDSWEWRRRVFGRDPEHILLCNPEDVVRGKNCKHDNITVCQYCKIPICNECWKLASRFEKVPKAGKEL